MKSKLRIVVCFFLFTCYGKLNAQKTEEYAILTHTMGMNEARITINIGEDVGTEVEYKRAKNEPHYGRTGLITEMNKLNAKGYELFSSSESKGNEYSIMTYVFVKSIED